MFHLFAKEACEEIEHWHQKATSTQYQVGWRWVEKFRVLDAFDAYWWWAQAGPFNEQEQQQWGQWYHPGLGEERKELL